MSLRPMRRMQRVEISDSDCTKEKSPGCCSWLTIPLGVGILAFLSMLLGLMIVSFGLTNLVKTSENQLHMVIRERFNRTGFKLPHRSEQNKKKSDAVWFVAAVAGIASGLIQMSSSAWFLCTVCTTKEDLGFKANMWIFCQLIVILMLLTVFGAIFIAEFYADEMVKIFGIDFLILNLFVLVSVIIVRSEDGQLKNEDIRKGPSALFVF